MARWMSGHRVTEGVAESDPHGRGPVQGTWRSERSASGSRTAFGPSRIGPVHRDPAMDEAASSGGERPSEPERGAARAGPCGWIRAGIGGRSPATRESRAGRARLRDLLQARAAVRNPAVSHRGLLRVTGSPKPQAGESRDRKRLIGVSEASTICRGRK